MNIRQAQLPKGWEIKKLGNVAVVSSGNSAPQKKELFDNGTYPFIRTSDVGKIKKGFISSCVDYLNSEGIKGLKLYKKGTILFPKSGASTFLNHRVMMEIDGYVSSHLATIKGNDSITDDRYLLYFLTTIDARNLMQDIAYPSLKTSDISLIPIPIPPLPEQQRIVAILDDAFTKIEKAKDNAEQNLKNSKELFESYLQGVFEKKGDGWEEKTLKELTSHLGDGLHGTPKYTLEGDYYFINGNNLTDGVIEFKSSTKRVSFEEYNKHKKNLTDRTILVSINGTLGNVAFYNNEKIILGKSACYFNMKDGIDKNYIKYVLSSSYFLKYAHKEATGATIKNVSLKTMREFIVPLPSLKQQQVIVQNLDALSAETQKLEAIYQQKINDLEELKKSVLQKAFAGELCRTIVGS